MGMLFDYFAAPSDEAAGAAVDAGPTGRFPTAALPDIDPTVALAKLEEMLTGAGYDAVVDGPRAGQALVVRNDGEQVVITVTDELQAALGEAGEARLREVAVPWSEIEEFWTRPEPADLAAGLVALADLARAGRAAVLLDLCLSGADPSTTSRKIKSLARDASPTLSGGTPCFHSIGAWRRSRRCGSCLWITGWRDRGAA